MTIWRRWTKRWTSSFDDWCTLKENPLQMERIWTLVTSRNPSTASENTDFVPSFWHADWDGVCRNFNSWPIATLSLFCSGALLFSDLIPLCNSLPQEYCTLWDIHTHSYLYQLIYLSPAGFMFPLSHEVSSSDGLCHCAQSHLIAVCFISSCVMFVLLIKYW